MAVRGCSRARASGFKLKCHPGPTFCSGTQPASRVANSRSRDFPSSGSAVANLNEAKPANHLSRGHSGWRPHAAARSRGVLLGRLAEVFRRTARRRHVASARGRRDAGTRFRRASPRPGVLPASRASRDLGRLRGGGVRGLARGRRGRGRPRRAPLPRARARGRHGRGGGAGRARRDRGRRSSRARCD